MATTLELKSGYAQLPVSVASVNYCAIRIMPDLATQTKAQAQIALVIDTSGSMDGLIHGRHSQKKIELVKQAAAKVIDQLADDDTLCVIQFSDQVRTLVHAQQVSSNRRRLLSAVNNLYAQGGTLMAGGITEALREFQGLPATSAVRKIVILTDGQTNDEDECLRLAEQTPIPFMLGGIGDDYNGRLLDDMARSARGTSDLIERAEEVEQFFTEVMQTVQATVITNASLGFDFRQRFRPLRIHQVVPELKSYDFRPVTPTNRHTDVALGDIQKEGMTLLVQYSYEGGAGFANEFQVAGLTLTYDMPPQTGLSAHSDDFTVQLADITSPPALDPQVKGYIDRAMVEITQSELIQRAQQGDVAGATQKLNVLEAGLKRVGASPEFIQQTVNTMRLQLQDTGNAQTIADSTATKRLTSGTRKLSLTPQPPANDK